MSTLLEKTIVELLQERNEKAISLLYDNYADTLYGVAFKVVKDQELAEDVVQESFVKIWKNQILMTLKSQIIYLAFRITRNTAIDKLRSISSKSEKEIQIDKSGVYRIGEDAIKPEHLDLKGHLNSIEPKYREVLEALFFEGMTQQEASEELDIPLGTIKSRLKIGLREMRKIYGDGIFSFHFNTISMKEKILNFLETDLLERYLLGDTSTEESLKVERYITLYPEVQKAYTELQENLEVFAKAHALKAPDNLKESILTRIKQEKRQGNTFYKWAVAASIVAIFSLAITFFFYNQNKGLQEQNSLVNNKIKNLEMDMKVQLEDLRNQYIVLNNPNTKRLMVNGNKMAKELKAVAYINPVKKTILYQRESFTATT